MNTANAMKIETVMTYEEWEKIHIKNLEKQRKRKREIAIKKAKQKLMGLALITISVIIPFVSDGDATVCLVVLPMGLYMLFAKEIIVL